MPTKAPATPPEPVIFTLRLPITNGLHKPGTIIGKHGNAAVIYEFEYVDFTEIGAAFQTTAAALAEREHALADALALAKTEAATKLRDAKATANAHGLGSTSVEANAVTDETPDGNNSDNDDDDNDPDASEPESDLDEPDEEAASDLLGAFASASAQAPHAALAVTTGADRSGQTALL